MSVQELERAVASGELAIPQLERLNPKQLELLECRFQQVYFFGANQIGKTHTLLLSLAMHLTGLYPRKYVGRRWNRPIRAVLLADTRENSRDLHSDKLFGPSHQRGSGLVPAGLFSESEGEDAFLYSDRSQGLVGRVMVAHFTQGRFDGFSYLHLLPYSAGAFRKAGFAFDLVGIDEESPLDVYLQLNARTFATGGVIIISATAERGESELWSLFETDCTGVRGMIQYTIDDALHLSTEDRHRIRDQARGLPDEETRLYGTPDRGGGKVYPTPSLIDPPPPALLRHVIGIDLPHTSGQWAAVRLSLDEDRFVVTKALTRSGIAAIKDFAQAVILELEGDVVPVAWPPDAARKVEGSSTVADLLRREGLAMLPEPAFELGFGGKKDRSIYPAIQEIRTAVQAGKFHVAHEAQALAREMETYRYVVGSGKVKLRSKSWDLVDALHRAWMMRRYARVAEAREHLSGPDPWWSKPQPGMVLKEMSDPRSRLEAQRRALEGRR